MKIHHLGIAVKSISIVSEIYRKMGYLTDSELIEDNVRNINIIFMSNNGMKIELIEKADYSLPSPIDCMLDKRTFHNMYHTCYEVENLNQEIEKLKSEHFIVVDNPASAMAFDGRKVCFLYNTNIGMIELLEV